MATLTPITLSWSDRQHRSSTFDPPAIFARLRDESPLRPMLFQDGHVGWLATGYEVVREILADTRFSIRRDLAHPPHELMTDTSAGPPPPGLFVRMDPPDHTRYRKLLVGEFTVHRMRALAERIREITEHCLDEMERHGPPVDLLRALATPVPIAMIEQLLGVPEDVGERFRPMMARVLTPGLDAEQIAQAYAQTTAMLAPLVERKRREPTDDVFSALIGRGDLDDTELTVLGSLLLSAGYETTSAALGTSTFLLLQHPDQVALLRADPGLIDNTVEELLRFPAGPGGFVRTATEDVEIGGELIREGQTVELIPAAANRDPAKFERPDELDITRSARGHVGFGHGIHQCLGQQLARVELRTVLLALFDRFPGLRLAVPAEEVPLKSETPLIGVTRLEVAW